LARPGALRSLTVAGVDYRNTALDWLANFDARGDEIRRSCAC
jgi:hypothetical protein